MDASLGLLFDLFDDLDHHEGHVHVALFFVAVLCVDELADCHLAAVVGRESLVFAGLAHSRGRTAELFALLSAERALQGRCEAFFVGAGFEAWALGAADHAAFDIFNNTDGLLEAGLVCGGLETRFLSCFDFFP